MAKKEKKEKKEKKPKTGKGGKKKLLIPLLALVVIAALAFVVIKIVLPKLGSGDETDKLPKKLEAYTIEEDTAPSLDTILEEGEGELLGNRGPGKRTEKKEDTSEEVVVEKYTYVYEVVGAADVMNRYLDLLLGGEQGFSLVDETYLVQEERPELTDEGGSLLLVKASVQEGHLFQLAIGWSSESDILAVRVAVPEGSLRYPEEKKEPEPASLSEQMDSLKTMTPSRLALDGSDMSQYDIYPVEGFVTIDGQLCRRFNVYKVGTSGDISGIIFYSGDMQHIYRMDVDDNSIITELR
ncbi:hypothetical protein D1641_15475 [Colidextribacter sp. OB.20]|uniref:hypothetical protein n=1 Tax=Colidextribacter sp. OB.20 TaxID=2304568 RepID=UPI00136B344B|nr:hypothetical protein [Colidextribacter sp. OB.20]NBI11394.1 hypothetical protein [Colidextribacter sp. OB.20]